MSKKNYNKMYDETKEDVNVEVESVVEEVVTEIEPVIEETAPVEETPKKKPEKKVKIGVVVNCERLNVRSDPSINSDVICVINKDAKIVVSDLGSTKDFYEVHSVEDNKGTIGFHGWCMKKYISVK